MLPHYTFSFCDQFSAALPLVSLQMHQVEIRITWASTVDTTNVFQCWANYIFLDEQERQWFANNAIDLLITQVQEQIGSGSGMQTFNFSHPVKAIMHDSTSPVTGGSGATITTVKVQYNGTEIGEPKTIDPHFNDITSYYHTSFGDMTNARFMIPYGLDISKYQPQGTLNFSRIDSARLTLSDGTFTSTEYFYAMCYNILKIENGMGGLLFAS